MAYNKNHKRAHTCADCIVCCCFFTSTDDDDNRDENKNCHRAHSTKNYAPPQPLI